MVYWKLSLSGESVSLLLAGESVSLLLAGESVSLLLLLAICFFFAT